MFQNTPNGAWEQKELKEKKKPQKPEWLLRQIAKRLDWETIKSLLLVPPYLACALTSEPEISFLVCTMMGLNQVILLRCSPVLTAQDLSSTVNEFIIFELTG